MHRNIFLIDFGHSKLLSNNSKFNFKNEKLNEFAKIHFKEKNDNYLIGSQEFMAIKIAEGSQPDKKQMQKN